VKRLTGKSPRLFKFCTHFIAIVGISLTCASTLSAQDRLFALLPKDPYGTQGQDHLIEIDTRPESFGQIRRATPLPTQYLKSFWVGSELYSIGRGRHLVWLSDSGQVVNLFDTLTNQVSLFPVLPEGSSIVAADSSRTRVFVDGRNAIVILDGQLGTMRSISRRPLPHPMTFSLGAHASSTERLFVSVWPQGSDPVAVDVIDVAVGRLERTFPLAASAIFGMAVDSDGRWLFVAAQQGLQMYDAQNGALLVEFPQFRGLSVNNKNALQIDETRRRLLLTMAGAQIPQCGLGTRVAAFDLDTLALLGMTTGGEDLVTQVLTGPRSPMYIFSPSPESPSACGISRLELLDPNSGALRQRVNPSRLWESVAGRLSVYRGRLALQSPPPAPAIQSQIVSGRRVSISWAPSDDALHYDIEAGSAPGLNDVAVSPGHTSTSFTVDGIPPGRYFVRVRAINWVGRSLPSNEVEIVVP